MRRAQNSRSCARRWPQAPGETVSKKDTRPAFVQAIRKEDLFKSRPASRRASDWAPALARTRRRGARSASSSSEYAWRALEISGRTSRSFRALRAQGMLDQVKAQARAERRRMLARSRLNLEERDCLAALIRRYCWSARDRE